MINFTPDEISSQLLNYISQSGENGVTDVEIKTYFASIAAPHVLEEVQNDLIDQNFIIFSYGKWRSFSSHKKFETESGFSPNAQKAWRVTVPVVLGATVLLYLAINLTIFL